MKKKIEFGSLVSLLPKLSWIYDECGDVGIVVGVQQRKCVATNIVSTWYSIKWSNNGTGQHGSEDLFLFESLIDVESFLDLEEKEKKKNEKRKRTN